MRLNEDIACHDFPCTDVNHGAYRFPDIDLDPTAVRIVLISEAAPEDPADDYYAGGAPQAGSLFEQTTVLAFQDADTDAHSLREILDLGVYLTTAVKCAKTGYTMKAATVNTCSELLARELAQFPNVAAYLLMGDAAIRAMNAMARGAGVGRVIPAGSTYKIRGTPYHWRGARALPSYLQAGPSFFIEKSKRVMIAEDIREALRVAGLGQG
jgi:uracil-DNA glycosylase